MKPDELSREDQLVFASEILLQLVQSGVTTMTLTTDNDVKIKVYMIVQGDSDDNERSD